jgi:hypothetical protein
MTKMEAQNNLEVEIYNYVSKTGKEPNLIVMHPVTWLGLCENFFGMDSVISREMQSSLKYRGIKVLRSLDIKLHTFEIG